MQGPGNRKWTQPEHRWKQAGLLCSPHPFLYQQHMGAKWGRRTRHMLARSLGSETCTHTCTPYTLDGITNLGGEMWRSEMPASTDASRSYSGGALCFFFSPSLWNPCCCCFFSLHTVVLFGLEMLCHFFLRGRFHLSASVGSERPRSLRDAGWRFNRPGVALQSECRSLGFWLHCFHPPLDGVVNPAPLAESIPRGRLTSSESPCLRLAGDAGILRGGRFNKQLGIIKTKIWSKSDKCRTCGEGESCFAFFIRRLTRPAVIWCKNSERAFWNREWERPSMLFKWQKHCENIPYVIEKNQLPPSDELITAKAKQPLHRDFGSLNTRQRIAGAL